MERDKQLDLYRGLSMIYVVCFIHVIYWLKIGSEPILSLMLFEMPIIFFISGASLSFRKEPRRIWDTLWSRFKRVVIPYYIYAVVMIALVAILTVVWHYWLPFIIRMFGERVATKYMFDITAYSWQNVMQIITFANVPQSPCVWHLWFILPYLILSCSFELQKRILTKINRGGYSLLCILAFVVVQRLTDNSLVRNVFCYNIFMVLGYCYYRQVKCKTVFTAMLAFGAILVLMLVGIKDFEFCPMQDHKFPPDVLFMVYNMVVLCGLSLLLSKVKLPNLRWVALWNERGYTLYLYQSIVYFAMFAIYLGVVSKIGNHLVEAVICIILMFVMSTIASYVAYPLEQWVMRKMRM